MWFDESKFGSITSNYVNQVAEKIFFVLLKINKFFILNYKETTHRPTKDTPSNSRHVKV